MTSKRAIPADRLNLPLIITNIVLNRDDVGVISLVDGGIDAFNKDRTVWPRIEERRVSLIGFEADDEQCTAKNAEAERQGWPHRYYPYALSDGGRPEIGVHITRNAGASSCFPPNDGAITAWRYGDGPAAEQFETLEVAQIKAASLDGLLDENGAPNVDFVKLNVQGSELAVLRGMTKTLSGVVGIELEMSFFPTYQGAPLFSDIDPLLREAGFSFFDLLAANRSSFLGSAFYFDAPPIPSPFRAPRNQLFEGHFLYLRNPLIAPGSPADLSLRKGLVLASIAEAYGQIEFALAVLRYLCDRKATGEEACIARDVFVESTRGYREALFATGSAGANAPQGVLPFEIIPAIDRSRPTYFYGAGAMGQELFDAMGEASSWHFKGFVDSFTSGVCRGFPVYDLQHFREVYSAGEVVIITSSFVTEIRRTLAEAGIRDALDANPWFKTRHPFGFWTVTER